MQKLYAKVKSRLIHSNIYNVASGLGCIKVCLGSETPRSILTRFAIIFQSYNIWGHGGLALAKNKTTNMNRSDKDFGNTTYFHRKDFGNTTCFHEKDFGKKEIICTFTLINH